MLSIITLRYQKTIAWFFFFIFSFEMAAMAHVQNASAVTSVTDSGYHHFIKDNNTVAENFYNGPETNTRSKILSETINPIDYNDESGDKSGKGNRKPYEKNQNLEAAGKPGPTQPEMQSFKSVGADNMVDLFSGDMSYNIPLIDVGGYPVSIHYNSGITMDQEASWVGLGWNINPGVISRSVRGLPDDFNGTEQIEKTQSIKPNETIGGNYAKSFEIFGVNAADKGISASLKAGLFYNNYKGWGLEYGITPSMSTSLFSKGSLTAGLSVSNNSQTGLDISPSFGVGIASKGKIGLGLDVKVSSNYNSRTGISGLQMNLSGNSPKATVKNVEVRNVGFGNFPLAGISFSKPAFSPTISMPYTTESYSFSLSLGKYKEFKFKSYGTLNGYTSKNYIANEDTTQNLPAYGYLYYQKAKEAGSKILMDFNRDKEVPYRDKTPHIGVPSYTYDVYSITGEGIGGSFRPYRGDVGFIFDHAMATKSKSGSLGLDISTGTGFAQFGLDKDKVVNKTVTGAWGSSNNILAKEIGFRNEDNTSSEPVYFKNPGEKVKVDNDYFGALGDTDLVNIGLVGISSTNTPNPVLNNSLNRYRNQELTGTVSLKNNQSFRKIRDKRTQVISFLTADKAAKYALDTLIKAYEINAIPSLGCNTNYYTIHRNEGIRKDNHLSEITVLNTEGKRYVYGIPAYNNIQQEVSFSVKKENGNLSTGLVSYGNLNENSTLNKVLQTDNFYSKEITPAYAHSFLLSSILSPDYVDITGNGITEDDQGDAIRFNYSRIYGENTNYYKWRAPYVEKNASYNEGLKSDRRDDRGSYTYGEKEVWYLNSLESKNMIAAFKLETDPTKVRKDVYGTKGENGGPDANQRMYQLKEINLYTKSDLIKYGETIAKPIKTVHFEYDYSLCKGHPGAANINTGKLTLRKIWFSYSKNYKGQQNPYIFHYDKDVIDGNGNATGNNGPSYNTKSYDKWGEYKDPVSNFGATGDKLSNADFPYSTQDAATANTNAAAWSLTEIISPSSSRIKITYESDDYGYVQNKRAMQMIEIAGFGATATSTPQNFLFQKTPFITTTCDYIFIKVPEQVNTAPELLTKYLEGVGKVYVKLNMKVPSDDWGSGSELVPCYFDIDSYGIANAANRLIWIKPKYLDDKNPFLLSATQFLRMNLYSKAYPYSEPGDGMSVREFLGALGSVFGNIKNATAGFYNYTLDGDRCKEVIVEKSFIRLNNPGYRKYGGGHRVKKVEIYDNWTKMTTPQQKESVYGQQYDYTTTIKDDNGADKIISSGVASFEPMVGKDENPFTVPSDPYKEQVGLLAPTDYFYIDEPIMESFYPSASVGYSEVTVSGINKAKKSSNGKQVTEFFTTKDFPTYSSYTPLIEGQSKFSYQNPKPKKLSFFKFNAKSYVTISQGFKINLNDMNGKIKRQASYAENDPTKEISYTKNFYRLENNNTERKLLNKVAVIDSADGIINYDGEMGKEVEVMVDLREQLSITRSNSRQLNLLIQKVSFIPGFIPIPIPLWYNKSEINRYRSAAITKVINQYGILDSVVVMDKGSKVTTKNLVYDSETGEVLLTRTNNEFDDAVYNFNYPAHWAYSGMSSAYKNIQKQLTGQKVLFGTLKDRSNEKFFESGDEIILTEKEPKKTIAGVIITGEYCIKTRKIWAIDASKGQEHAKGIYFIDGNGSPVTTINNDLSSLTIIRSGKRNMLGAGVGSVTSLANPVKMVNEVSRIIFDTGSHIITASAGIYKDLWQVDSTVSPVDTCYKILDSTEISLSLTNAILLKKFNKHGTETDLPSNFNPLNIATQMQHNQRGGGKKGQTNALYAKTILNFDFKKIPKDATIISAKLSLSSLPFRDGIQTVGGALPEFWSYTATDPIQNNNTKAHYNYLKDGNGSGNSVSLTRVSEEWQPRSLYSQIITAPTSSSSAYQIGTTLASPSCDNLIQFECKNLLQDIVRSQNNAFGIQLDLVNKGVNESGSTRKNERRSRSYYSGYGSLFTSGNDCNTGHQTSFSPVLSVKYKFLKDTCVLTCKLSIRPDAINPYKFGVLGNWRMNRAYSYYDKRKENDAAVETDIRRSGEIEQFLPFWEFASGSIDNAHADTNVRWVWNSELTKFNRKGLEIENADPLGRFNSAQYGYNKQLPVAVTQNSKNRNMMFDGFEDYDYKTSYCEAECVASQCLPPVYPSKLNNCDTLQDAWNKYLSNGNPPLTPPSCDTTTWDFPQSPVGTGKTYSFQSMFNNGSVGYPDSTQTAATGLQLRYLKNICITTAGATYEANFKSFLIPNLTPINLLFTVPYLLNGAYNELQIFIGHAGATGRLRLSGYSDILRPDLTYNFTNTYQTLKVVYKNNDNLEIYINNTLLGTISSPFVSGLTFKRPIRPLVLQFSRCIAKIDWVKFYDEDGNSVFNEQFNAGCSSFAQPTLANNCTIQPDCSISFANYFNSKFKTAFNYAQIGALYSQCGITTSPCGKPFPSCNIADSSITRTSGFDRFADFTKAGGTRTIEQKHTGKYSLKVLANKIAGSVVKLATIQEDTTRNSLSIKVDTITLPGISNVKARGTGLKAQYSVYRAIPVININGCMRKSIGGSSGPLINPNIENANIDRDWETGSPQQFNSLQYCAADYFSVNWTGKLQPNYTAKHVFRINKGNDDVTTMRIDGSPVNFTYKEGEWVTDSIALESCRLYNIIFTYSEKVGDAKCRLSWANAYEPEPVIIPIKNFYSPTVNASDTAGSCLPVATAVVLSPVKPSNMINPLFSPVAGTKMLVGAWVKESKPCYTGSYANTSMNISFGESSTEYTLIPTGNIIEGWQRIESIITIPSTASSMNVSLKSLANVDVYFDDIRFHPFNANMKSYVYNPANLRLMAELDENNYASFYEYDDDGTLIRVKKETFKGIKTIQETRSALIKQ